MASRVLIRSTEEWSMSGLLGLHLHLVNVAVNAPSSCEIVTASTATPGLMFISLLTSLSNVSLTQTGEHEECSSTAVLKFLHPDKFKQESVDYCKLIGNTYWQIIFCSARCIKVIASDIIIRIPQKVSVGREEG